MPFISHGEKPTRREALEYYRRVVDHYQLPIRLYEPVETMYEEPALPGYRLATSTHTLHAPSP